ncbi:hypothetical protein WDU94_008622 [Cyamophila willieti]
MGDPFKPVIIAYGSLSNSKNKAKKLGPLSKRSCKSPIIPGLSSEKKDKLKQLSIVQTINLAASSSPDRVSTKDSSVPVVNLDDDVITLSPDLLPFSIPEHSDLSQNSEATKVLAVVTLEESPPPIDPPICVATDSLGNAHVEDPLQIVITLPESPDLITVEDSSPEIIMDSPAGNSEPTVEELMEQIKELIVKNESSEKNQSKAIAKVNSRLSNADSAYVQSEEFVTLLRTCVEDIKKDGTSLYVHLKTLLDKLKSSTQNPAHDSENSSVNNKENSLAPSTAAASTSSSTSGVQGTSERKHITPTPVETPRVNRTPLTLDTSSLKKYDKSNYVQAMEWFDQLIGIIQDIEPDKALCKSIMSKLRNRLEKAEKKYLYSSLFLGTLKFTINGILTDPGKVYGFIRQTTDELKANMKCPDGNQPQPSTSKVKDNDSNQSDNEGSIPQSDVDLDEGLDDKTRAHIRKLEKTLKKLEKVIKELEEEEVIFSDPEEDDTNSSYIKVHRYQERYMKILHKIFELRRRKVDIGRPIYSKVRFDCTEYPAINRTIERFYNKTRQFPDYGDVLGLVQKVSETSTQRLSSAAIQHIAEKAFTSLGEILKQRRMEDDYDTFLTRIGSGEDPADHDEELARKLEENKKQWSKVDEVMEKFVLMQEEKKKKGEDEEIKEDDDDDEEENEEEEDEDDEDKEKDNDSEVDKDPDDYDSENEKENNTAESNDEADETKSDGENRRRKLQERRGSDNENVSYKTKPKESGSTSDRSKHCFTISKEHKWSQSKINRVLEEYNIVPVRISLDDCVELFHNSPEKEESFFKYLNLKKIMENDDDDDEKDAEMEENVLENGKSENRVQERLDSEQEGEDSKEKNELGFKIKIKEKKRDVNNVKRKLPTENDKTSSEGENSNIKVKIEVEDQDEIVTSTTQEMEDEIGKESEEENNSKPTCDSLNDSGDSIGCVTSSMHGSEPMDVEEIKNKDGNVETNAKDCDIENKHVTDGEAKTEVKAKTRDVEAKAECDDNEEKTDANLVSDKEDSIIPDDSTKLVEDHNQTYETVKDECNSKEVTESDTSIDKNALITENMEDPYFSTLGETHALPKLEDFIDKTQLKLLLDVNENVDEIYTHLEHCQIEVNAVDLIEDCQVELEPVDINNYVEDNEINDESDDSEGSVKRDIQTANISENENDSAPDIDEKPKEPSRKRKNRVGSSDENTSQSDNDSRRRVRKRQKQIKYKESEESDDDNIKECKKENSDSNDDEADNDSRRRIRKRQKQIKYKESDESDDDNKDENIKESEEQNIDSNDDEACGLPVKKTTKRKPENRSRTNSKRNENSKTSSSNTRKRRKSTSSEEEEERRSFGQK